MTFLKKNGILNASIKAFSMRLSKDRGAKFISSVNKILEKGNTQKEILPKQTGFFRRFSWGMRKYRIHCHMRGELSMKRRK